MKECQPLKISFKIDYLHIQEVGEHEKSIDVLFNQLNDLDAAMEYCLEIYNRQQSSSLGSSLFYKLLEDLLMNYHENCELIVRLLSEHGAKIPILKTLSVLPRSFQCIS